jgi:membrane associated rhomboid family serine protease
VQPPAFNVPAVILWLIAAFVAVHAVRTYLLGPFDDAWWLLNLAFLPGCYGSVEEICTLRAEGAGLWSPLTYAFLHGDWMHLGFNTVWLLAFGSPVAVRLGPWRTLAFCAAGSMAGAALFELMNPALVAPVIGASGTVSALMGGASRFAIGSPARRAGGGMIDARRPLLGIIEVLRDRTVLFFVIMFFVTNIVVGAGAGGFLGADGQVAWEAHLGGFAFGFLFFGLFDRAPRGGAVGSGRA